MSEDQMREAAQAAIPGVLDTLGWPDDRAASAHVEADGHQVTPAGLYWELAGDVAEVVLTAAAPLIEAEVREQVAREIEARADVVQGYRVYALVSSVWADRAEMLRHAARIARGTYVTATAAIARGSAGSGTTEEWR